MTTASRTISDSARIPFRILLLTCCVLLSGCDLFNPSEPEARSFVIPIANRDADLELALTISERQHGLQKRLELGDNEGMAFLFEDPQQASFWMKNTRIPLDIGFFTGDGILREIHQMFPNVEVPVKSYRSDIVLAIEMNKGWFKQMGIKPGDTIDLKQLMRAIEARGEDPADYSLQTSRSLRLE
jgi:uncharacterized membrane protein (UPF0127 family)